MASTPTDPANPKDQRKNSEQDMLMREVDEAVRQDEVSDFARKYGWPIGIAVVLGLAAFGGFLLWQDKSTEELEADSDAIIAAYDELEAGNADIADEELALIGEDSSVGAQAVAKLTRAAIALQEERIEDAVALYDEIASNEDVAQPLRDMATLRSVTAQYDTLDPQQVIDRLGPMANADHAFFGSAGELVAMAYLAQDKPEQAGPLLVEIAQHEDAPDSLRSRTRQLAGVLGYDAIEDVDEMLAAMAQSGANARPRQAPAP